MFSLLILQPHKAPLPKGGCQKSLIFDWGILNFTANNVVNIFANTSKITINFIVRNAEHCQISLFYNFRANGIFYSALFFIMLRTV